MTAIFTGVNARCRHDKVVPGNRDDCYLCEWENEILFSTPPFLVECIDGNNCDLEKGAEYTVLVVVRDGESPWGVKAPGVLLKSNKDTAFPVMYAVERFMKK